MNNTENEILKEIVLKDDSKLKDIIVSYVGEKTNPENDEVTVERIVDVFAEEFPEFLVVLAEENWINGYTQALNDVQFLNNTNNTTTSKEAEDEYNKHNKNKARK